MGTLAAYLKQHRGTVLLWAAICAVFCILFALYHLPLAAVAYGAVLTGSLGALVFAAGFLRYRRKSGLLRAAAESPQAEPELPEADGLLEEQYQKMIRSLLENQEGSGEPHGGEVYGSGGFLHSLGPSD